MFKVEYSTITKGNLDKQFTEKSEADNFIKTRKSIGGFQFTKFVEIKEDGTEHLQQIGTNLYKKENYKIEWK